jgi:hypothetical protein
MHEVLRLGGENGQFQHKRASNTNLDMKILHSKITGTQTSCSNNFGGKLSFILSFLIPERPPLLLHIYFHSSYLYKDYSYSQTSCIKCWVSTSHIEILIKFPYFADTSKRGDRAWKQAQRQPEDRVTTIWVALICNMFFSKSHLHRRKLSTCITCTPTALQQHKSLLFDFTFNKLV